MSILNDMVYKHKNSQLRENLKENGVMCGNCMSKLIPSHEGDCICDYCGTINVIEIKDGLINIEYGGITYNHRFKQ